MVVPIAYVGRAMRSGLVLLMLALSLAACRPPTNLDPPPAHSDPLAEVSAEELFRMGKARAQSGDLGRAEQYLAAAITKGYPERDGLRVLLRVCLIGQRYRHALLYAGPYLRRNPTDWALRYLVASIHAAMGDAEKAKGQLMEVLTHAPDAPGPHFLLAELVRPSDAARAHAEYTRYLALAPDGKNAAAATQAVRELAAAMADESSAAEGEHRDETGSADPSDSAESPQGLPPQEAPLAPPPDPSGQLGAAEVTPNRAVPRPNAIPQLHGIPEVRAVPQRNTLPQRLEASP